MRKGQRPGGYFRRPIRQVVGDRLRHRLRPASSLRLVLQVDRYLAMAVRPKSDFFRRPRYHFVLVRVRIRHVRGDRFPSLPRDCASLNDVAVGVIVHVFDWRGVRVGRVSDVQGLVEVGCPVGVVHRHGASAGFGLARRVARVAWTNQSRKVVGLRPVGVPRRFPRRQVGRPALRKGQRPGGYFRCPIRQVVGDLLRHRLRPASSLRLVLQVHRHLAIAVRPKGNFFRRPRYHFVLGRIWIRDVRGNRITSPSR